MSFIRLKSIASIKLTLKRTDKEFQILSFPSTEWIVSALQDGGKPV